MNLPVRWPDPGRYVLAVSGGADSMVLMHLMASSVNRPYDLVVAHLDHGLRPDSRLDREFVQTAAEAAGLVFEYDEANLGHASEAQAREVRYRWLKDRARAHGSVAVVTAHHVDDLIETSLLNLARGTGRHGLSPFNDTNIVRPLVDVTRAGLRAFANQNGISWREDVTNNDLANPRNFVRHVLMPAANHHWKQQYITHIERLQVLNAEIDHAIGDILSSARTDDGYSFSSAYLKSLSLEEVSEVLIAAIHNLRPDAELDRPLIRELALFAVTSASHKYRPVRAGVIIASERKRVRIIAT